VDPTNNGQPCWRNNAAFDKQASANGRRYGARSGRRLPSLNARFRDLAVRSPMTGSVKPNFEAVRVVGLRSKPAVSSPRRPAPDVAAVISWRAANVTSIAETAEEFDLSVATVKR
jgi:hypothetical protein